MGKEEKVLRGEKILSGMKAAIEGYYGRVKKDINAQKPSDFSYYEEILHAVSEDTHEVPIPREEMCIALADAEEQGKRVYVEPDEQFLPDKDGKYTPQFDGWSYHLEIR